MARIHLSRAVWPALAALALVLPGEALAQGAAKIDGTDTAWILTSTALVLFMTLPGLALFYGGLPGGIGIGGQLWTQLAGVVVTVAWAGVLTFVIIKIVQATVGLRVDAETESEGLDITAHGERGYHW